MRTSEDKRTHDVTVREILSVLDQQQGSVVCSGTLNVRVFVLERLSAASQFICDLFQREMEPLETLLEAQSKLLDIDFDMDLDPNTAGWLTHLHVGQGCPNFFQWGP